MGGMGGIGGGEDDGMGGMGENLPSECNPFMTGRYPSPRYWLELFR